MSLRADTEAYIQSGGPCELEAILEACRNDGSLEALLCVTRLFEDMYDGITFNMELKAPPAWELACWGRRGLDQLVAATQKNPTSKNRSLCIEILTAVASKTDLSERVLFLSADCAKRLQTVIDADPELSDYARSKLTEFILSVEDEEELISIAGSGFSLSAWSANGSRQAKELFAAISTRWLTVSAALLKRYETLLTSHAGDERVFQEFFTQHPQFLDPMAAEIWPQPNLHGAQFPDFVIRRFDNSYVVVEIEAPGKMMVTSENQLSAYVTHAVAQVTEYRRFLERIPGAEQHFPEIDEVSCLVVVGLEASLNDKQRQALRNENRQRHALQVVGFDWLAKRSEAIRQNMISVGVTVRHVRVI
ncbi:MAG: hypothetical protein JWN71_3205 [Xanthobacteraceae bacterium]|nr:hypothetical protein [Xanthobacteraceae bacterium]